MWLARLVSQGLDYYCSVWRLGSVFQILGSSGASATVRRSGMFVPVRISGMFVVQCVSDAECFRVLSTCLGDCVLHVSGALCYFMVLRVWDTVCYGVGYCMRVYLGYSFLFTNLVNPNPKP